MKKIAFASSVLFGVVCTFLACNTTSEGAIVLAVQTDVPVTANLDGVGIGVSVAGVVKFSNLYSLRNDIHGKPLNLLPATLAIVEPAQQGTEVTIRTIGFLGPKARVIRDVITTIPHDRVVTLRVPLQFLSLDDGVTGSVTAAQLDGAQNPITASSVKIHLDDDPSTSSSGIEMFSDFNSTCSLVYLQTRIDGSCVDAHLDSSDPNVFPPYDPANYYGEGGAGTPQTCFDMDQCCGKATSVVLDRGACTFPIPQNPSSLNVAMKAANSAGFCGAAGCLVPLDLDPVHGFSIGNDGLVHLPLGVCTSPNVADVMTDPACPPKAISEPIDGAGALCAADDATSDGGTSDANASDASGSDAAALLPIWYHNDVVAMAADPDPTRTYLMAAVSTGTILMLDTTKAAPNGQGGLSFGTGFNPSSLVVDGQGNYSLVQVAPQLQPTAFAGTYDPAGLKITNGFTISASSDAGTSNFTGTCLAPQYVYYTSTLSSALLFAPLPVSSPTNTSASPMSGSAAPPPTALTLASDSVNLFGTIADGASTFDFVNFGSEPYMFASYGAPLGTLLGTPRASIIVVDPKTDDEHLVTLSSGTGNAGYIYDLDVSTTGNPTLLLSPNVGNLAGTPPFNLATDRNGTVFFATTDGNVESLNITTQALKTLTPAPEPGATTVAYAEDGTGAGYVYFTVTSANPSGNGIKRIPLP